MDTNERSSRWYQEALGFARQDDLIAKVRRARRYGREPVAGLMADLT